MTKKRASEDELEDLSEHYENTDDEDLLAEWEQGEQVPLEVRELMVSRSVRFSRSGAGSTMERLHEAASARGIE